MKVHFKVAAAFCKSQFIETGVRPSEKQSFEFDAATVSRETRAFLSELTNGQELKLTTLNPISGDYFQHNDYVVESLDDATPERAEHFLNDYRIDADAAKTAHEADKERRLRKMIDENSLPRSGGNRFIEIPDTFKSCASLSEALRVAETENSQIREKLRLQEIEKTEREAQAKIERQQRDAEKLTWIEAHGSDFLKDAASEGFDCQRKYAIERGDLELPGFVVDIEDTALWNSRSCPSVAALKLLKEAKANGHNAELVWLTAQACEDSKDDMTRYDDWEQCEAVIVRGFLGKYDAVKEF